MIPLTLRKFTHEDIRTLFSWFTNEAEVVQWAGIAMSWPLQKRSMQRLIRQHNTSRPSRQVWAVCRDQEMVGHFQFTLNQRLRTIGLGRVALAPECRGLGFSHSLMELAIKTAFSHSWVHRLDLLVYAQNQAALRAYEKAGFVLEGRRRQTTPVGDEIWDTLMMSLLRTELEPRFDKRTEGE